MTDPSKDLLVSTEGVDEGSADSTVEGPDSGAAGDAAAGGAAAGDGASSPAAGAGPEAAPPLDMESPQSRAARDAVGTGQQLQAGEG